MNANESFESARPVKPEEFRATRPVSARTLPHRLEAEEYLLSCIFIDGAGVLASCYAAGIGVSSFYDSKHGILFDACEQLHASGVPIDIATVAEQLKTSKKLDQIGGYAFLTQVSSRIPTTAQTSYFIGIVAEQAQLREIIRIGTALVEQCYGFGGGLVSEHLATTFSKLSLAVAGSKAANVKKWTEVIADVEKRAVELIDKKQEPLGATIHLPWPTLDKAFKPLRRKEVVIIAARPSVGKSSLMRPLILKPAIEGMNVLVETLEMSPEEIAIQMATSASKVTWDKLPNAHHEDQKEFVDALKDLALPNLHIFDCDPTLAAISARAEAIHSVTPLDILAVDYLGLIADCDPRHGETKAQAVGGVTKALKRLAKKLNCVVIILSQLNRSPAKENREPQLSDLRDSGDIEQDADRVWFIDRPDEDKITGSKQSDTDSVADRPSFYQPLIQAKGRNVGTGRAEFYFRRETTNFIPAAKTQPLSEPETTERKG